MADFNITANAKPDAPGVYVAGKKIASLGLRIRKGCSFHGLALNVNMDLSPFLRINPCGYQGLEMVQTADISELTNTVQAGETLIKHLAQLLNTNNISYKTGWDEANDH